MKTKSTGASEIQTFKQISRISELKIEFFFFLVSLLEQNFGGIEEVTGEQSNFQNDIPPINDTSPLPPSPETKLLHPAPTVYDPFEKAFQGPILKSSTYQRDRKFTSTDMGSSASTPNSSSFSSDSEYHDSFKTRYDQEMNQNHQSYSTRPRYHQDNVSRGSSSGSSNSTERSPSRQAVSKRQLSMIQESRFGDNDNCFETNSDTSSKYHEEMDFQPYHGLSDEELPSPCNCIICQNDGQGFASENESVSSARNSRLFLENSNTDSDYITIQNSN